MISSMIRTIFSFLLFFLISLILILVVLGMTIQTDWFWKTAFPKCFNHFISGGMLQELNYERKTISVDGNIFFKNLIITIQKDRVYQAKAAEVTLKDLWRAIHPQGQKVFLKISDFSLQAKDLDARQCLADLNLDFQHLKLKDIGGHVSCAELSLAKNLFLNLTGEIQGDSGWLALENARMNYRQGQIFGRMTVGLNDAAPYVLDFTFENALLDQSVFDGSVLGAVSGTFQANGFAKALNGFEMVIDAPQGAKVRADLLQSIVPYLPAKSSVKKDLEGIIKIGGYVYFEISHAVIRKVNDNTAFADVSLKTKKLNLVLNPTIDINIEGGLQSVINVLEFFSNSDG